jgi:hypothetical protein
MDRCGTQLTLEPGERYTEYDVGGILYRVGPPRLITWTEGKETFCRFECETEIIYPPSARSAPRPKGEGPIPQSPSPNPSNTSNSSLKGTP